MQTAERLRETNRAEYLLYLWQVEDLIRACGCDFERLQREYLSRFTLDAEARRASEAWYADLCRMMVAEGCREHGHLPLSRAVLSDLSDLHTRLVAAPRYVAYREQYYRVLPYLVEMRARGAHGDTPELELCFNALYGVLMLRLGGKPVSEETQRAADDIARLLAMLSALYKQDRTEPLDFS